jgi:hypothetical protein
VKGVTVAAAHPFAVPRLGDGAVGRTRVLHFRGRTSQDDEILWHRGVYEAEIDLNSTSGAADERELVRLARLEDARLKRLG